MGALHEGKYMSHKDFSLIHVKWGGEYSLMYMEAPHTLTFLSPSQA